MAVFTVANGGGNINAGATYVGGVAPTSADTIVFTSTSGQLTVNTPFTIAEIIFTNWLNTITMTSQLTVNGNVTLAVGMGIAGSGILAVNATATLTSNGKTWTTPLSFLSTGSPTITFADNWTITSTFNVNGSSYVFNGNTLNIGGNFTIDQATSGTTNFVLNGTGTWSGGGSGNFRNNLTIKTGANITINGVVNYNTGTLTVESGAVVNTGGSTIQIIGTVTTTFDVGSIKLFNVTLGGISTIPVLQLNSPLYITGTATLGASGQPATINGSPVYIESGALTSGVGNANTILGTSQIIATGDRFTYLDSATNILQGQGIWRIPITVNANYFLMFGRFVLNTGGSLTINSRTVENRATFRNLPELIVQASTTLINAHKCKFKNITITAGSTLTMNEFFTGSPEFKSIIRSESTTNYTVTFTDRIPKKAFHVNVRNCNVTQTLVRNQLNIINRDGNAGFNTGIIFGESGMCGFPLNKFPTEVSYPTDNGFKNGFN